MPAGDERSEPPYLQIVAHYRALIASGELQPGERLPTVRALATEWAVARQTVDRAIAVLRGDGLIATAGRGGTVVAGGGAGSVAIAVEEPPGITVTSATVDRASDALASELGVRPGSAVIVVRLEKDKT